MTVNDNKTAAPDISRADVEKALWQLTGYTGDQTIIDGVMLVMDAWNACTTETLTRSSPAFRDGYYHALVTMAEAIIDTGGRMRMVPPEAEPVLRAGEVDALAEAILRKLPDIRQEHEDRQLLADPQLQESLAQLRAGNLGAPLMPARKAVKAAQTVLEADWDGQITCTRCGETKDQLDFHKDSKGRHGRKTRCRECESTRKSAAA